jgi:hypothetical protein
MRILYDGKLARPGPGRHAAMRHDSKTNHYPFPTRHFFNASLFLLYCA